MALVPIQMVSSDEWAELHATYGNGNTPVLPWRSQLEASEYPNHVIARGMFKRRGEEEARPTDTGYLRGLNEAVIGSVRIDIEDN